MEELVVLLELVSAESLGIPMDCTSGIRYSQRYFRSHNGLGRIFDRVQYNSVL